MAKGKPKKLGKWSYSKWSMYHKCPSQYEWHYILGHKRKSSPALARGIDIHKKAENYVNGTIKGVPNELVAFTDEFKKLRKEYKAGRGYCEPDISYDSNLKPATRFTTDFFVGFADYAHLGDELTVIDYKTGRKYPDHREQGHAYSTALLALNPDYDRINVEFWYLDHGDTMQFSYDQADLEHMLEIWNRRVEAMFTDKTFECKPNRFCGWCERNKKNGGDCNG